MVSPGITGLWQVSGRSNTSYEERLQLVAYYVRNWSLWLDIYLLLKTVRIVRLRSRRLLSRSSSAATADPNFSPGTSR